jgi:PAS domain S-box-containing protein
MLRSTGRSSTLGNPAGRAAGEVERLNWALAAIRNVNRVLIRARSERELFAGVCKAITRQAFFRLAWVGVPKSDAERSVEIFAAAGAARDYLQDFTVSWGDGPFAAGPTGRSIKTGAIQVVNHVRSSPQMAPWREKAAQFGLEASLVLPIRLPSGEMFCVLTVHAGKAGAFGKRELELFTQFGEDLGFGIDVLRTRAAYRLALAQAEEQDRRLNIMASVLENSAEGVVITDAANRIIATNPAFAALTGYMPDEVVGKDPSILASGRHDPDFFARLWQSVRTSGQWQGDIVNRTRYGREFTARLNLSVIKDERGNLSNYIGSMYDVSPEREAEDAIRREKKFSDSMMDSMPGIIYFYDREGRFLRWNRNFMEVSGYAALEILAMHPLDFFTEAEKPLLRERIDEVFATGESSVEASFLTKDGRLLPHLFTGRRVTFDNADFLVGMGIDISKRKADEVELANYASRLQAMSRQLLNVQEGERRRLGRELHDTVGQELAAVNVNLTLLRTQLTPGAADAVAARLDDAEALIEHASRDLREVMVELRPPGLEELGLVAALRDHAARVGRRTGLAIAVRGAEPVPRLDPTAAIALFRIAQEALNNTVKHAAATKVTIDLRQREAAGLLLEIADDGKGFAAAAPLRAESMGMATMSERAEAVGGKLAVTSAPGRGTRVAVALPRSPAPRLSDSRH